MQCAMRCAGGRTSSRRPFWRLGRWRRWRDFRGNCGGVAHETAEPFLVRRARTHPIRSKSRMRRWIRGWGGQGGHPPSCHIHDEGCKAEGRGCDRNARRSSFRFRPSPTLRRGRLRHRRRSACRPCCLRRQLRARQPLGLAREDGLRDASEALRGAARAPGGQRRAGRARTVWLQCEQRRSMVLRAARASWPPCGAGGGAARRLRLCTRTLRPGSARAQQLQRCETHLQLTPGWSERPQRSHASSREGGGADWARRRQRPRKAETEGTVEASSLEAAARCWATEPALSAALRGAAAGVRDMPT